VFTIDLKLRGVPAGREQVLALHQSINAPHLAVPGKQAGPAQAFIAAVRVSAGFAVFVYLYLADQKDCAVYLSDERAVPAEKFEDQMSEALGFVESMGFMMDNMNFRALKQPEQESLIKTLPVFQRDPKLAITAGSGNARAQESASSPTANLGRLFSAF
jgi:hypothetical protein